MTDEAASRRVYLAGPDVFRPDAHEALLAKKAVCAAHGLEGVTPFDNEVALDPKALEAVARQIYASNAAFMRSCGWCIANVTPFRGVSVDAGTAFEVGFMVALGRTVYGYSTDSRLYEARVAAAAPTDPLVQRHIEGGWVVETFGLAENLMLPFGIEESGGLLCLPAEDREGEEALFVQCVEAIAAKVAGRV